WEQQISSLAHKIADPTPPLILRESGVVIITGGLGGIGLSIAHHLSCHTALTIILLTRKVPDVYAEWQQSLLDACKRNGSMIKIYACDVSHADSLNKTLTEIKQQHGDIHGIIHSAGTPGGGIISLKQARESEMVFAAKVESCLLLSSLLSDAALDFFICCS